MRRLGVRPTVSFSIAESPGADLLPAPHHSLIKRWGDGETLAALPSRPGAPVNTFPSKLLPHAQKAALTAGAAQVPRPHCQLHLSSCPSFQGPARSPSALPSVPTSEPSSLPPHSGQSGSPPPIRLPSFSSPGQVTARARGGLSVHTLCFRFQYFHSFIHSAMAADRAWLKPWHPPH